MTDLTRRGLLGAGGAAVGLAACSEEVISEPEGRITVSPDTRTGYPGSVSFDHGVASGDPLSDRVILWTRVTIDGEFPQAPVPISYGVFADEAKTQPVAYGVASALPGSDFTVKVDADGLEPGTEYYYQFVAKTTAGDVNSPTGRTKTTAASGGAPVRFAVISCSNYPFGFFHVYREISKDRALDAVIHLGDYLYEYGVDGYGGSVGQTLGRNHEPPLEIVSLGDYRMRHAQYKLDPDLQAAHAAAPWLCTWDDHESTNNSYRDGAENHNPENNEGNWSDRKQAAVQAYLEWMPVRDPEAGRLRESIYRKFDFGDVATVICLESRLTGRSDEISWFTEVGGLAAAEIPVAAAATMVKVNDKSRTMLGTVQESWLSQELKSSVASGKPWQVLANQVIMARVRPPNFKQTLSPDQIAAQQNGFIKQLIEFSQLGLPMNLDAWDGFPAARNRLYNSASAAGARLVTLTGDTHTAWANTLVDENDERRGVEFGCSSVTSPGFGTYMTGVDGLGQQFADANPEVDWHDTDGKGWILVILEPDKVTAVFNEVTDVTQETYTASKVASFSSAVDGASMTALVPDS
ncbi:MAG: alkaline phosphatase D family protein [Henriciella sp.]|nr:alkaline phosphatase D family protein [Henriciella sp.]